MAHALSEVLKSPPDLFYISHVTHGLLSKELY